VWGDTYNQTLDDAFAIQSAVAQQVVAAVGAVLAASERASIVNVPTANPEAYRLYLQAQEHRNWSTRTELELMQRLFERAIELDPEFALAHAGLAHAHGAMFWFKLDPSPERADRQVAEAETALRLAPNLAEAHWAMGMAQYWGRRNYQRALDELGIALQGLPNKAGLVSQIGFVHRRLGHWAEVNAAFEKASRLDPRDWRVFSDLGGETFAITRRYADAVRAFDQSLTLPPYVAEVAVHRAMTLLRWRGDVEALRTVLDKVSPDADLGVYRSVIAQRARLLLWDRRADELLSLAGGVLSRVLEEQRAYLPASLYAGWAHQMKRDSSAAREAFRAALVQLEAVPPSVADHRVHAARGLALAGLGRNVEAQLEARWLQQSSVYREDAMAGPIVAEDRAMILAGIGEVTAALDEIERLLAGPSLLTVHTLRLDPRWDPIREQPRFKALLVKFANPEMR